MAKIDDELAKVKAFLKEAENQQLAAGKIISALVNKGYDPDFLARKLSVSRRKLHYLLSLAKAVGEGLLTEREVIDLGFTRASSIIPSLRKGYPKDEAIRIAKEHTTEQVRKALKGSSVRKKAVVFFFTDPQVEALYDSLSHEGALKHGRGLRSKEEALLAILTRVSLVDTIKKAS